MKEKIIITSELSVDLERVREAMIKDLSLPDHAMMLVSMRTSGDHDRGTYKEEVDSIKFKWDTELI